MTALSLLYYIIVKKRDRVFKILEFCTAKRLNAKHPFLNSELICQICLQHSFTIATFSLLQTVTSTDVEIEVTTNQTKLPITQKDGQHHNL